MTDKNDAPPSAAEEEETTASAPPSDSFITIFIKRPIFASVISLLIVIAGLAALMGIEVRELPEVDQPVVTVRTDYRGAAPEIIDAEVTSVIEAAVSRVDGVVSISSSSSYERSSVVAEFSPSTDVNIAASDVKNAVSAIQRQLPDNVEEPVVVKADSDGSPIMRLVIFAPNLEQGEVGDLVERVIAPRLQAVEGVALVDPYGIRQTVIRVRLQPVELAARGVSVDDVASLVSSATISAPSGTLRSGRQELLIRAESASATPEAIGALRLNDETLLSDVAVIEWGVERESMLARFNDAPAAGVGILRQAQSNTVAVADGVKAAVEELRNSLPSDIEIRVTTDDSIFIKSAIEEVAKTLIIAVVIVVFVIFLFLRSARTTLIPTLAIPISLIGTLGAMWLAGFSINILTLLALVMAAGLVVDDAIVVTENVQRWRSKGYGKRAAAMLGTREIVFAVISTSATLAAVFIPIAFMPGQAGRLFTEFGFVMAFAVLISSFTALTLCPMLTAKLGDNKPPRPAGARRGVMDSIGGSMSRFYSRSLAVVLNRPMIAFALALVFAAGAATTFRLIPKELTPAEDRGSIFMMVSVQQSANFDYLKEKVIEIERRLQPLMDSGEATGIMSITGLGNSNRAFVVARLADWSERSRSQQEITAEYEPLLTSVPGANVNLRRGNSLGIRGAGQGLQFAIAADEYDDAAEVAELIAARLQQDPIVSNARLNFETSQPQLNVVVDRDAAARLGVDISSIARLISTMSFEYRATEIFVGDRSIDILLSGGGDPVDDPGDLANLFVKSRDGTFIPLSSVASIEEVAVAAQLAREERRRAVPVTASLNDGAPLGDAVELLREASNELLPDNMGVLLMGEAKLLETSTNSAFIVFGFAALIVLLVLAAQFESFVSAFVIMATVPFGIAAALYAMALTGMSLNYFSQIGLVLLIGIMAKNGILIVEFANQLRDRGYAVKDAIQEAAETRLRPVLMTALSTVLGGLPLVLSTGAGAESRAALGWVVVGGLGFATFFTLFLTPAAFLLLGRFGQTRSREAQLIEQELEAGAQLEGPRLRAAE